MLRPLLNVFLGLIISFIATSCTSWSVSASGGSGGGTAPPPSRHEDHPPKREKAKKGGPPPWAPAHGYRRKMRHYYFPKQNMYYDKQEGVYIYFSSGNWQVSAEIPISMSSKKLKRTKKVQIEYEQEDPYRYNEKHRERYGGKHRGKRKGPPEDKPGRGGPPKEHPGKGKGGPPGR